MCQSFDSVLSHHRGPARPVPLQVDDLSRSMHSRILGPFAFQVVGESMSGAIGVTGIVTTIIAQENVDVI